MIVAANAIAKRYSGLTTTGIFRVTPGTVNTMAHTVNFTLDLRHIQDDVLETMLLECQDEFEKIAQNESEKGCALEWKLLVDSPAVKFDQDCISMVEKSAADVCSTLPNPKSKEKLYRKMISGAGHDSCYTSQRCPTSMIFTPTRAGISHNPVEYCSSEDW